MLSSLLAPDVPRVVVHYAKGPPFKSMMDLEASEQAAVLERGEINGARRFQDPTYLCVRARVEAELTERFREAGGAPLRARPHYALLGRSARAESVPSPPRAYVLQLDHLPAACVSFTWGDSFRFDDAFRRATGGDHPASRRVYPLQALPEVLLRWAGSTSRPAWQEIEVQLWFDPRPDDFEVVDPGAPRPGG